MSEPIFTSQLKNEEKSIDGANNRGRPIWKYQTHVFLLKPMSKFWQACPVPKYQMPTIVEWAGFAISSDIDMAPRAINQVFFLCSSAKINQIRT